MTDHDDYNYDTTIADGDGIEDGYLNNLQNALVPVGGIIAWAKTLTGAPALPDHFVECNGQTLSDAESPFNGETIPDLNGDNRFLRGNSTSGDVGGAETMAHTHDYSGSNAQSGSNEFATGTKQGFASHSGTTDAASNTENRPPFYNVVWVMRIK